MTCGRGSKNSNDGAAQKKANDLVQATLNRSRGKAQRIVLSILI